MYILWRQIIGTEKHEMHEFSTGHMRGAITLGYLPAELNSVVPIPGRGCQECWGGKYCLGAPYSGRDIKPWVL